MTFYYFPDFCAGSFRMEAFVKALVKNPKINKIYIFTTMPQRYGHMKGVKKKEVTEKITIIRINTPEHKNKFYMQIICHIIFSMSAFFYFIKYWKKIDTIFSTTSRLGTAFLGYLFCLISRKKFAVDIRDIFSDSLMSLKSSKKILGIFVIKTSIFIEKKIIRKAFWINFVSPGFLNYKHLQNSDLRPNIYTNGIDNIFIKNRKVKKRRYTKANKRLVITYAGNIGYGQGLERTIPHFARYFEKKIIFNIIGDGSSVELINARINELNCSNVIIIEPVTRLELIDYYNQSDCLLLQLNDVAAFENVLPSKIFEYASFDKPILAGVSGVAKSFLLENLPKTFIYNPNDYNHGIMKIEELIQKKYQINNDKFVKKFKRDNIMSEMVNSLISTIT